MTNRGCTPFDRLRVTILDLAGLGQTCPTEKFKISERQTCPTERFKISERLTSSSALRQAQCDKILDSYSQPSTPAVIEIETD